MKLSELLEELFRRNITLQIRNEQVHCDPPGAVPQELKTHLLRYETTIAAYMRGADGNSLPFYPLSSAQKTIWFLDQLAPHPTSYKIRFEVRILSKVNERALKASLQLLLDRHPALRTTFANLDGEPVQQIHECQDVSIEFIDSSKWSRKRLSQFMQEVKERPMNLETGPLLEAYLFTLPRGKQLFWLFLHHITADFLSLEMVIDEFGRFYSCLSKGGSVDECQSRFPTPKETYLDYVRWKLDMLAGDNGHTYLAYFRQLLSNDVPVLELPTDHPRPPVQTYNTSARFFNIGTDFTRNLKQTVQGERTSLYPFLVSALFVLLYRYTGQTDLLIGSPRSEQGHKRFKNIVGLFDNPVPLRADLSGNPSFRSFLRTIHNMVWKAFDHEDYPSHLLPTKLHLQRDASHPPLFQVLFALQEEYQRKDMSAFLLGQGGERLEVGDLLMQSVGLDEQVSIFVDLQIRVFEEHDGLTVLWQYNTDVFDETSIERMGEHFQVLLGAIIENPETHVAKLPIMTETERHKILVEWNRTRVDSQKDQCIHELFEKQAEKTSEAIAVVGPTIRSDIPEKERTHFSLTYGELNQRANQLAHYLRKLGVGPEVLVGICIERSIEMIVGILGILKAGGAYVPLDPVYPEERLAFMLDDAQVTILLTQDALLPLLPENSAKRVCLDSQWETFSQESGENPRGIGDSALLAYVIYTSGSTGQPKGVLLEHQGLCNLITSQIQVFEILPESRILQFASLSFDVATSDIFMSLSSGATLYIPPKKACLPGPELLRCIREHRITLVELPVSVLSALPPEEFPDLKTIIVGGDVCTSELVKAWAAKRNFYNAYGPTEATVCVTTARCHNECQPSIGRPLANTEIYILDPSLQPVPIGVSGELYIGGSGLARGYLNQHELTQKTFIPHPFRKKTESRLYRTGDIARYLPDGNIEFLGRVDSQVKVRGFRIELREIEYWLASHPNISEAVVVVHECFKNEKCLIAYVVPESHELISQSASLQTEHIEKQEQRADELYQQHSLSSDPSFNIAGWHSSYTGKQIPSVEMQQWIENTVERIARLHPKRVLEIGCGTGLLLFQLAPQCEQYWGTDFSDVALNHVRKIVEAMSIPQVCLWQKTADDFEGIPSAAFDMLILNSVAQYFPNLDYFLQVIEGMIRSAVPGATIFIGDVRSLALLEAFHTSVQLYQASDTLSIEQLQQRIQTQMKHENELVIAPEFFTALQQRFSRISHVRILPKKGSFQNELTRFRYDVMLCIEADVQVISKIRWLDWQKHKLDLETLRELLVEEHPEYLGVSGIPNARLQNERTTAELLRHCKDIHTVAELREHIERSSDGLGVDPEVLWDLEDDLPYRVELRLAHNRVDGALDAFLIRGNENSSHKTPVSFLGNKPTLPEVLPEAEWNSYANNPIRTEIDRKLIPQLRTYLQKKLPEYMLPSTFVILKKLPLTPNGKVDRQALPEPDRARPELENAYEAPRSELEEALVEVWIDLLDLEQVGVFDDFFELGGDSLTATRLIAHVRSMFDVELPIARLFEVHSIAGLAEAIEAMLIAEINALSDEEAQRLLDE